MGHVRSTGRRGISSCSLQSCTGKDSRVVHGTSSRPAMERELPMVWGEYWRDWRISLCVKGVTFRTLPRSTVHCSWQAPQSSCFTWRLREVRKLTLSCQKKLCLSQGRWEYIRWSLTKKATWSRGMWAVCVSRRKMCPVSVSMLGSLPSPLCQGAAKSSRLRNLGPSNNPANFNPQLTISERPLREPQKGPHEIDWSQNDMIGSWCVVTYDKELYPGIILAKDEANVQVKCMHHAGLGKKRFYWPPATMKFGTCWTIFWGLFLHPRMWRCGM